MSNNDLSDKNISFNFGIDDSGNYGYYKAGADTVTPFKKGEFKETILWTNSTPTSNFSNLTVTLSDNINNFDCIEIRFRYSTSNSSDMTVLAYISDWVNTESATANGTGRLSCAFKITNGTTFRGAHYISDTEVNFSHAYNINTGVVTVALSDNTVIPVEIIGLSIV